MDVKKLYLLLFFLTSILSAQVNNRFLVSGIFTVKNSDITDPTNFKMVSIPGDTIIPIKNILPGTAGINWMAFDESGEGIPTPYVKDKDANFSFSPGNAFWIINQGNISIGPFNVKKVTLKDNGYYINLHKGWNLISNPFDKSIDWKAVRLANNLQNDLIYYFYEGYYDNASVKMQPYLGYYFYNRKELDKLFLPYPASSNLEKSNQYQNYLLIKVISDTDTANAKIYLNTAENNLISNQLYPLNNFVNFGISVNIDNNYYSEYIINSNNDVLILPLTLINKKNKPLLITIEKETDNEFNDLKLALNVNDNLILENKLPIDVSNINNLQLLIYKDELSNNILPYDFNVSQNFPNPFNPETKFYVSIPSETYMEISVFNSIGEKINTIYMGEIHKGTHLFSFNAKNITSGIYFYTVKTNFGTITKKMLLIK